MKPIVKYEGSIVQIKKPIKNNIISKGSIVMIEKIEIDIKNKKGIIVYLSTDILIINLKVTNYIKWLKKHFKFK